MVMKIIAAAALKVIYTVSICFCTGDKHSTVFGFVFRKDGHYYRLVLAYHRLELEQYLTFWVDANTDIDSG